MGVELQHVILYGYEFNYDDLPSDYARFGGIFDEYDNKHPDKNDFVIYPDGRGGEYCVAGIVQFITDSTRRNGPQRIPVHRLDSKPDEIYIKAMNDLIVEDLPVEPVNDNPCHIVFTNDW